MDPFRIQGQGNLESLDDRGNSVRKTSQNLKDIEKHTQNALKAIREGNSSLYNDEVENVKAIVKSMEETSVNEANKSSIVMEIGSTVDKAFEDKIKNLDKELMKVFKNNTNLGKDETQDAVDNILSILRHSKDASISEVAKKAARQVLKRYKNL